MPVSPNSVRCPGISLIMTTLQPAVSLAIRRRWFDENAKVLQAAAPRKVVKPFFTCPCCGYPTLGSRGSYETCLLCWWEDDGQDEADADEVLGGPNGNYSLAQARTNFQRHLVMYPPAEDPRVGGPDSASTLEAKRLIVDAYGAMCEPNAHLKRLWRQVARGFSALEHDLGSRSRKSADCGRI